MHFGPKKIGLDKEESVGLFFGKEDFGRGVRAHFIDPTCIYITCYLLPKQNIINWLYPIPASKRGFEKIKKEGTENEAKRR